MHRENNRLADKGLHGRIPTRLAAIACLWGGLVSATALATDQRNNPTLDWLPGDIDWDSAPTLRVQMQDYYYEPNEIQLQQDRPYRVILDNVSNISTHDLVELDFFHGVVLQKINVDGVELTTPHIHQIKLRPNSKATLYLVPKVSGNYDVFCSVPGHREEGMDGHIQIVP